MRGAATAADMIPQHIKDEVEELYVRAAETAATVRKQARDRMNEKFGCILPSVLQLPWDLHGLLPSSVQANIVTLNVRNGQPGEFIRNSALGT